MKRFKMKKLAAIDIGSNAVRLLIANTYIENNKIDTYLRPDGRGGAWFVKPIQS